MRGLDELTVRLTRARRATAAELEKCRRRVERSWVDQAQSGCIATPIGTSRGARRSVRRGIEVDVHACRQYVLVSRKQTSEEGVPYEMTLVRQSVDRVDSP